MPAGNITQKERMERMLQVKELLDEDCSENQIAEKLGMGLPTVKRNIAYLQQLNNADLRPQDIAERRSELYMELLDATSEAKSLFLDLKQEKAPTIQIKYFFNAWLDAIELRAKLYGLTSVKSDTNIQINNVTEYATPDTLPKPQADALARAIKDAHERKVKDA